MKQVMCSLLACLLGAALARYQAIPIEEMTDSGDLLLLRPPREVEAIGAVRGPRGASEEKSEKYVDFGAHTGAKGSYGWHVDFPVYQNHHS